MIPEMPSVDEAKTAVLANCFREPQFNEMYGVDQKGNGDREIWVFKEKIPEGFIFKVYMYGRIIKIAGKYEIRGTFGLLSKAMVTPRKWTSMYNRNTVVFIGFYYTRKRKA